jgi:hypothetical protein
VSTLSTTCLNGGVSCGGWDFQSGGTEGWTLVLSVSEPHAASGISVSAGQLVVPYNGAANPSFPGNAPSVRLLVPICSPTQTISSGGRRFRADIRAQSAANRSFSFIEISGSVQYGPGAATFIGGNDVIATDFFFQQLSGQQLSQTIDFVMFPTSVSYVAIAFVVSSDTDWAGTVFLDNIRIE